MEKENKKKRIFGLKTESGRRINTTAEHPYFVKRTDFEDLMGDDLNLPFSPNSIKNPSKSSGFDLSLSKIEKDSNKASGLSCGILSQTTENILSLVNLSGSVKCSSLETNTLCSDLENSTNSPLESPFGLKVTSYPSDFRNFNSSFFTFSSNRNLNSVSLISDNYIVFPLCYHACIMQGCLDVLSCERCNKACHDFLSGHAGFKHLQDLPDHDSCALESRSSSADFAVRNDVFVDFNSHRANNDNPLFKSYELGEWLEVRYLKAGDEIAVPDYPTGAIKWEKIASIKTLELKITDLIEIIAKEYFLEYKKTGGGFSHDAIINDFRIIACASLHSLDIVVSHDKKSMLADKSIQAYRKINTKFQLRSPDFKTYGQFKNELRNWRLS